MFLFRRIPGFLVRALAMIRRKAPAEDAIAVLTPGLLLARLRDEGPGALAQLTRPQIAVLVRGMAAVEAQDDPVLSRDGERLMHLIACRYPEGPVLMQLHRLFRSGQHPTRCRPALRVDLAALHGACLDSQPVSFTYRDRNGAVTSRRVLPLELVHPHAGILLLAWCELRHDWRSFHAHAMDDLVVHDGSFSGQRLALLHGMVEREVARQDAFYDA